MSTRIILFVVLGLALLGTVLLHRVLKRLPVTIPILYTLLGWGIFSLPIGLPQLDPVADEAHGLVIEYTTEFAVIVSLLAVGLSIDRPFSLKPRDNRRFGWLQVWPLIGITMPLTIAALTLLGYWWLGMGIGSALLLGAALSPTDPVLARSIQVGPPGESERKEGRELERDDVRFDLTVEAGINDGLAFPFTYLALAFAALHGSDQTVGGLLGEWLLLDVGWRCVAGVVVGYLVGRLTSSLAFRSSERSEAHDPERNLGVVIFGTLFAAYGLAEMIEGYGFLAVFVGAVTVRQLEPDASHPQHAHRFVDQVEQIVLVILLIGLGGLVAGGVLNHLTWPAAAIGLLAVVVLRPVFGWIAMAGKRGYGLPAAGRGLVAFAGIRGLGTIYYLAYGTNNGAFQDAKLVWATCIFTVLVSVVVHGLAVPPIVRFTEQRKAMAATTAT